MEQQLIVLDACVLYPPKLRFLFAEINIQSIEESARTILINAPLISFRISKQIIDEVTRNIRAKSPNMDEDKIQRIESDLRAIYGTNSVITNLNISQHLGTTNIPLSDPNDEHVLALARQVEADRIITSDHHFLGVSERILINFGITVLHPYQFFQFLAQNRKSIFNRALSQQGAFYQGDYRRKLFEILGGLASLNRYGELAGISNTE